MNEDKLREVAEGLEGASKKHAEQAKTIRGMLGKSGPFKMNSPLHACWEGYEMFGTKMKDDRKVPNCIPTKKK